jgi:MtrB/PioB family decaheme-associated outer membrane protein
MKNPSEKMAVSVLSLAVQGALIAMFAMPAHAADEETVFVNRPANVIEFGVNSVSADSAKFGEYSGLDTKNWGAVAGFDIRGGAAYEGNDSVSRWQVKGVDLGTTSRSLESTVSNQGQWSIGLGYDELRHNISDTFQTPQQGTMGGNAFTMPANFGAISGAGAATGVAYTRSMTAAQLATFHTEKVGTTRKNSTFSAGLAFNEQLGLQFEFNRLDQSGAKLMAVGTSGGVRLNGTAATKNSASSTKAANVEFINVWRAEAVNVVMNPTNYKTDTFNLSLNWAGEKGYLTGGYYGSIFTDGFSSLTSENALTNLTTGPALCVTSGTCGFQSTMMSTAPNNSLHQLNLNGGYAFTSSTKLTSSLSYGRNTQNSSFISGQPEIVSSPLTSLNGLVVTTHADLKLTNKTTKDLTLSAGIKYNVRDNRTSSNLYQYYAINSVETAAANSTTANKVDAAANAPYSTKRTQIELAADYRLAKSQNLRVALERDSITRSCNSYAMSANCLVNPGNTENKFDLSYRLKALDAVSFNAGYTYADRTAEFDGNAITPLAGLDVPTGGLDVNGQNFPGYIAYPYAARKQNLVKMGVTWQATEKLDFGLNGRYASDKYDAALGVQDGTSKGINLDATYTYAEQSSVSAYYSQQNNDRNLKAGAAQVVRRL